VDGSTPSAAWLARILCAACVVACAVTAALVAAPEAAALEPCGNEAGYAYAGFQSAQRGHGVRATLAALESPQVKNGHVAAWIGIGGSGQGPNGSNQWLQVGLNAFKGTGSNLYYEVTAGGAAPQYHELAADVSPSGRFRVAVLEVGNRPNWWRVWLDGRPVSPPIHLRGSSGRYQPIATAETWDGGSRVCNGFAYSFDGLGVASSPGGLWKRFVQAHRFQDRGYRVTASASSFVARVS
jgi:hypothetical protein